MELKNNKYSRQNTHKTHKQTYQIKGLNELILFDLREAEVLDIFITKGLKQTYQIYKAIELGSDHY